MKRMIVLATCFFCLSVFVLEVAWGDITSVTVYVKNKKNQRISADSVKMGTRKLSANSPGTYITTSKNEYHIFSAQKESEKKSKMSKVRPPYPKIVTIRFSRH